MLCLTLTASHFFAKAIHKWKLVSAISNTWFVVTREAKLIIKLVWPKLRLYSIHKVLGVRVCRIQDSRIRILAHMCAIMTACDLRTRKKIIPLPCIYFPPSFRSWRVSTRCSYMLSFIFHLYIHTYVFYRSITSYIYRQWILAIRLWFQLQILYIIHVTHIYAACLRI